jgi:hypothetical protein
VSFSEATLRAAHKCCSNHQVQVESSNVCGCFYCLGTFSPTQIEDWVDDKDGTALCPKCGIDSVLADKADYPVSDPEFLKAMHAFWFERTVHVAN